MTDQERAEKIINEAASIIFDNLRFGEYEEIANAKDAGDTERIEALLIAAIKRAQEVQERITWQKEPAEEPKADKTQSTDYAPELDITSPQFDLEAFKKAIEPAGGLPKIYDAIQGKIIEIGKIFYEETIAPIAQGIKDQTAELSKATKKIIDPIKAGIENMLASAGFAALKEISAAIREIANSPTAEQIREFLQSEEFKKLQETADKYQLIRNTIEAENPGIWDLLEDAGEEVNDLAMYVYFELQAERKKDNPDFRGVTLTDIIKQGFNADGTPTESIFKPLIKKAIRQRKKKNLEDAENLPAATMKQITKLKMAVDIVGINVFDKPEVEQINGQYQLKFETISNIPDALVLYGIDFNNLPENLKIEKHLTPFDKLVHAAVMTLYYNGYKKFPLSILWRVMGNKTRINSKDLQRLNDSLTKMKYANIVIDNHLEASKSNYHEISIDGSMIDFRRVTDKVKGTITEGIILLLAEPLLGEFARSRNQITQIPRELLEVGMSKTDANLRIMFHLSEKMAQLKNHPEWNPETNLETIYKACKITERKQKQRAAEKIKTFMEHAKKIKYIYDYKLTKTKLTIIAREPKELEQSTD